MVPSRHRLCYVVSSEMTVAAFLKGHIASAMDDHEVFVVVNTEDPECLTRLGISATLLKAPIERRISPGQDVRALWVLYRLFRQYRFDLVHSVSPKAGLLAMLAAWLACVPQRVHFFTGQVWVTRHGWRRLLLKQADRLLAALTTHALIDSPSQRDFLVGEGVLPSEKAEVLGKGSICGVDGSRFHPNVQARREVRQELGIGEDVTLLLFLGRLNRDKGVIELASAFALLAKRFSDVDLLLVGPDEEGLMPRISSICGKTANRLRSVDFTNQPERFMAAADIFCLPSHREGFGMVAIEAAAVSLPAVASRIYGITDAVVDGVTGYLHAPGDVHEIVVALVRLVEDATLRRKMGNEARERACRDFSQQAITRGLKAFYEKISLPCR